MERLKFFIFVLIIIIVCCATFGSLESDDQNVIQKDSEDTTQFSRNKKSRTLYDYQTRVVAYKDLIDSKCLLEILNGGESLISLKISDANENHRESLSKSFVTSSELSKRQIWRLAGQRITEFCRGFPTYLIKDTVVDDQNVDVTYMLNDLHIADDFSKTRIKRQVGRVRGQTQSQYLNFGQGGEPGKAEAESSYNGTRAVVTGTSGIGQAQSQSSPVGCEECFGPGFQDQTLQYGARPRIPGAETRYPSGIPGAGPSPSTDGYVPSDVRLPQGPGGRLPGTDGRYYPRPGQRIPSDGRFPQGPGGRLSGGIDGQVPGDDRQFPRGPGADGRLPEGPGGRLPGADGILPGGRIPEGDERLPQGPGGRLPGVDGRFPEGPGGRSPGADGRFPEGPGGRLPGADGRFPDGPGGRLPGADGRFPEGPGGRLPGADGRLPVERVPDGQFPGGDGRFPQGPGGRLPGADGRFPEGPGGRLPGVDGRLPGERVPGGDERFPQGPSGRLPDADERFPEGPGGRLPGADGRLPGERVSGGDRRFPQGPEGRLPGTDGRFPEGPGGRLPGADGRFPGERVPGVDRRFPQGPGGRLPGADGKFPEGPGGRLPGADGRLPGERLPDRQSPEGDGRFPQGPGERLPGADGRFPEGPGGRLPGADGRLPGGDERFPQGPGGRLPSSDGRGPENFRPVYDGRYPQGPGARVDIQIPGGDGRFAPGDRRPSGGQFDGELSGNYQSNIGHAGRFYGTFQGQYEETAYGQAEYRRPGFGSTAWQYDGGRAPSRAPGGGYVEGQGGSTWTPDQQGARVQHPSTYPGGGAHGGVSPAGGGYVGDHLGTGRPGAYGQLPGGTGRVPPFDGASDVPRQQTAIPSQGYGGPGTFSGTGSGATGRTPDYGTIPGQDYEGSQGYGGTGGIPGQGYGVIRGPGGPRYDGTGSTPGRGYEGTGGATGQGYGETGRGYGGVGGAPAQVFGGTGSTPGQGYSEPAGGRGQGYGGTEGASGVPGGGYGGTGGTPGYSNVVTAGGRPSQGYEGTGSAPGQGYGSTGADFGRGYGGRGQEYGRPTGGTPGQDYSRPAGTPDQGFGGRGDAASQSAGPGWTDQGAYGTGGGVHAGGADDTSGGQKLPQQYTQGRGSGTVGADDADSLVQTSVQQSENGTLASAQANGKFAGGTAQSQVSGTYSGSGSFSASAGSDDGQRGALTSVTGGKDGASSSAQGRGGQGQSQAQVVLSSETGDTLSSAQTNGLNHGTQTQVQASEKGGVANAQANGPGNTASQAQIGFTPYDENEEDEQEEPFKGGGTAAAQSGTYSGMTQTQIQGKFKYGIKYAGAAQAGSGTNIKNFTEPHGPFKPINFTISANRNGGSQSQSQKVAVSKINIPSAQNNRTAAIVDGRAPDPMQTASTNKKDTKVTARNKVTPNNRKLDDQDHTTMMPEYADEDYAEYEDEEAEQTERPSTRNLITQTSNRQRQHIILDPLEDFDATVHQSKGDFPEDGTILQPGQLVPGSGGYKIPAGFRGKVRSIANGRNTYAVGQNSHAQSVTLSPGSGRIIYKSPVYAVSSNTVSRNGQVGYGSGYTYQPAYQPVRYGLKSGKVLPNFVSVSKSETGSKDLETGEKTPSVFYTQSSTCGMFTNTCVFSGGRKLCYPKPKTNPDGSLVVC